MSIAKSLREAAKTVAFKYTRLGCPHYPYNLEPIELALIVQEFERFRDRDGSVVEIGVARGMTTRFLCEHVRTQHPESTVQIYAIDTFSSFTEADLDYETTSRGKDRGSLQGFAYNDHKRWQANFRSFPFVEAIQADCSTFDFRSIAPVKLSILDVDLYLPTKNALVALYDATIEGGVILVDDVLAGAVYDGAHEAYMEFVDVIGIAPEVVGNKCGVIRKGQP